MSTDYMCFSGYEASQKNTRNIKKGECTLKKLFPIFILITILIIAAGCAPAATPTPAPTAAPTAAPKATAPAADKPTTPPAAAGAGLKVTGLVGSPMTWQDAEVKAMPAIKVESTNKNGDKSTYEGVLLSALLQKAAPKADAKTVVFVAGDGFTADIALADLMACKDCIVSFRDQGGFSTVLPGQSTKLQVKGVVEIQVK